MSGSPIALIIAACTGMGAGLINALAGGGSLLSFPMLTGLGLPSLIAASTSSVALSPGYGGAALAQRRELSGQGRRLALLLPTAALGGLLGAVLLLSSGERLFRALVPWLILLGSLLLALQEPLRRWLRRREAQDSPADGPGPRRRQGAQQVAGGGSGGEPPAGREAPGDGVAWNRPCCDQVDPGPAAAARVEVLQRRCRWLAGEALILPPVFLASIYGGYFGAGLSVILLAALAICLEDSLPRLNGLKQAIALAANLSAALLFSLLGRVDWSLALALGLGALVGGALGGRLVGRLNPDLLRRLVVGAGMLIALLLLLGG